MQNTFFGHKVAPKKQFQPNKNKYFSKSAHHDLNTFFLKAFLRSFIFSTNANFNVIKRQFSKGWGLMENLDFVYLDKLYETLYIYYFYDQRRHVLINHTNKLIFLKNHNFDDFIFRCKIECLIKIYINFEIVHWVIVT